MTLEAVQAQGTALLLPTDSLFAEYPALPLTSGLLEKRVRCGNPIPLPGTPDGIYRVYSRDRQLLLPAARAAGGTLTSIKNFLWSVNHERTSHCPGFFDGVHLGHAPCCAGPLRRPPCGAVPPRYSPLTARRRK